MKTNVVSLGVVLIAGILSAGCVTSRGSVPPIVVEPVAVTREVSFTGSNVVPEDFVFSDPTDPEQLARFALALASRGDHSRSAVFFSEASKGLSTSKDWRQACLLASANERLRAGDIAEFRATVQQVKSGMTDFELASVSKEIAVLFALADAVEPNAVPDESTPQKLRDLFETR